MSPAQRLGSLQQRARLLQIAKQLDRTAIEAKIPGDRKISGLWNKKLSLAKSEIQLAGGLYQALRELRATAASTGILVSHGYNLHLVN